MAKKNKKYYSVIKPFTIKGKFKEIGDRIYLTPIQKEILINKNLIK